MYLIVKCEALYDQYETDARRTPITLANDWEEYVRSHVMDYDFEVWELQDGRFVCIKEWW